jgi:hypothetical protein
VVGRATPRAFVNSAALTSAHRSDFETLRRAGEVKSELLLGSEADEVPRIGKRPLVTHTERVQHDAAGLTNTEGVLEQIDKCLRRQWFG